MKNKTAARARAGNKTRKPIAPRSKKVKSEPDPATAGAGKPAERARVTFESLATETDPLIVKQGLLRTLDQLYEDCVNKVRVNRAGVAYPDPDSSGAAKATDLAARIQGTIGVDPVVNQLVWLMANSNSVSVECNDHRSYYNSVAQEFEASPEIYSDTDEAVRAECIKRNQLCVVRVYPITPVGFALFVHWDICACIELAYQWLRRERGLER